jgi:hypothetical protein
VRQSTLRQVFENTESTHRQYDLRQRATALGWRLDQIVVIDSDLGQSGASAVDRAGFCYVRHYRRRNSLLLPELMQGLLGIRFHGSPGQTP